MKWFTIHLENPPAKIAAKCKRNSAGQFIVFDGRARSVETMTAARELSKSAGRVSVFTGKTLGKLVASFNGGAADCTYCGKAHL